MFLENCLKKGNCLKESVVAIEDKLESGWMDKKKRKSRLTVADTMLPAVVDLIVDIEVLVKVELCIEYVD